VLRLANVVHFRDEWRVVCRLYSSLGVWQRPV